MRIVTILIHTVNKQSNEIVFQTFLSPPSTVPVDATETDGSLPFMERTYGRDLLFSSTYTESSQAVPDGLRIAALQGKCKMNGWKQTLAALAGTTATLATVQLAAADPEISGFAIVQENSALKLSGVLIYLYGIYVPPTEQSCYTFVRPPPCGPRASLALDFKTSGHFVHCWPVATNSDGSLSARCRSDGDDLGAWMLQRGWAVALPDAPLEYRSLERIAHAKGIGIWGSPVDLIRRPYKQ